MDEQGIRLGDIKGILRRRARVMAYLTGAIVLASLLPAALLPSRYESYTTLLIEPQSVSKKLVEAGFEEGDLMARLHLMTMQILSRARLSRVIDDLGLYADLQNEKTREEIIEFMRSQIRVEPVLPELESEMVKRPGTEVEINTFRLYFRDESAATAASVANRLANDFIDEHIRDRVQVSGDTAEFIEAELQRLAQRLREVEGQIAQVKAENAGSLPEDRGANEILLQRAFEALRGAQRNLSTAESDAVFYKQQALVSRESERGDLSNRTVTPAMRLRELEIRLGELRARGFTDKHPDIVITQAEIQQLRAQGDLEGEGVAPLSVAEQEAQAEARRADLRAESERQEVARLQAEIDQTHQRLAQTPRVAEQLDGLAREYVQLSENFGDYSNKRLEASVAANMERRQKGEQFRVLEPAFLAQSPVSPNRPLILMLGILLGVAAGAGAGILLEAADSSYHEPRSLQQTLRIPVLASIPGIWLDADRRARRRRRMREAFAAAAVSGAVLLAAGVGYVYVNMPWLYRAEAAPVVAPAPAPAGTAPSPAAAPAPAVPPAGAAATAPPDPAG